MNPFLRSFGVLAIRLLIRILRRQGELAELDHDLLADANRWLEKHT